MSSSVSRPKRQPGGVRSAQTLERSKPPSRLLSDTRKSMLVYLLLSLCIGAICGGTLAYLLAAQKQGRPPTRQWLVYGAAMLIVLGCAALIGQANRTSSPAESIKLISALLVLVGFAIGYYIRTRRQR